MKKIVLIIILLTGAVFQLLADELVVHNRYVSFNHFSDTTGANCISML